MDKLTLGGIVGVVVLLFAVTAKYKEIEKQNPSHASDVFGGALCLGGAKYTSGDVSGERVYYTKGVTEEQCRMACGSKKANSWAHSETKECFCGEGPAKEVARGEFRSGDCLTNSQRLAANRAKRF